MKKIILFVSALLVGVVAFGQLPNEMLYVCGSSYSTGTDSVFYEMYSCGDTAGEKVSFIGTIKESPETGSASFQINQETSVKPFVIRLQNLKPNTSYSGIIYVNANGHAVDTIGYLVAFKTAAAPTGITDIDQKSISVFPNPFSNTLSITTQETQLGLRITDVTGREIVWSKLQDGSNSINTESFPSGIYFATLTDSKGLVKETRKICKE